MLNKLGIAATGIRPMPVAQTKGRLSMSVDHDTPTVHDCHTDANTGFGGTGLPDERPDVDGWPHDGYPDASDDEYISEMERRDRAAAVMAVDAKVTAGGVASIAAVMDLMPKRTA